MTSNAQSKSLADAKHMLFLPTGTTI
jgi:hypothetical protein